MTYKGRRRKVDVDDVMEYIKSKVSEESLPPPIREIAKKFDISTSTANLYLDRLSSAGKIKRSRYTARGISIVKRKRKNEAAPQ